MTLTTTRYGIFCGFALILAGFLTVTTKVQAQTIHLVLAADTNPTRAGERIAICANKDKELLERSFRTNVPASQLAIHSIPVEKMWAADILRVVEDLSITPSDTVVFFYSGHGAYDTERKQQFFQLSADAKGNPFPGQNDLFRNDVIDRILKKTPRLSVIISDCCNVQATAKIDAPATRSAEAMASVCSPKTISPLFESLFVSCKGIVDITSSKLGEASGIDWGKRGSCFTLPMIELLQINKDNYDLDWKSFVAELTPKVQENFSLAYPKGATVQGSPQYKQTVFAYSLPGMSATRLYDETTTAETVAATEPRPSESTNTAPRKGPRFGVRAIAEKGGGLRVTELIANSPGESAGFEVGDVILEINGKPINTEQEYSDAVDGSPKQMRLKMKNCRDGKMIEPTIELGW